MRDNRQNINFYIKVNYQDKEHQLLVSFSSTVKQLKQIIITYFKLNQAIYDIYYKNLKLDSNDMQPLSLLFDKDKKPLLFILEKNKIKDIIPKSKQQTSLTLFTKMPESKLNEILENFFKYKQLENDANIKHTIKDMYIINFTKPSLCADFQEFYDSQLRIEEESKDNSPSSSSTLKFKTATNPNRKLILPKINLNRNYNQNFQKKEINKSNNNNKFFNGLYDRKKALDKVILINSKSDKISDKFIRSGKYRMHHSSSDTKEKNNNQKRSHMRNKFNNYKGVYKYPYMDLEEKYYREKFLDKKNWINKNGFLPCVGRKNNNFIPNYVTATPSESPLLFKFRNVSKNKWINPKGFH
jgi:hypothetical protein